MTRKALLISPEACIGCRGCQIACKEWNQLPATKTTNRGSAENSPDLSSSLYNKIRYIEMPSETNMMRWLFVSQRCMHCDDAGCIKICPAPGALYKTKEGAVAFNKDKCIGCKLCASACPLISPFDAKDKISNAISALTGLQKGFLLHAPRPARQAPIRGQGRIGSAKKAGYENSTVRQTRRARVLFASKMLRNSMALMKSLPFRSRSYSGIMCLNPLHTSGLEGL